MKWNNKGHEFDQYASELEKTYLMVQKGIYVFGAGMLGKKVQGILTYFNLFRGYIDNDLEKQKNGVDGIEVVSFDKYMEAGQQNLIVIAADKRNIPDIVEQLSEAGISLGRECYDYNAFMNHILPVLLVYYYDISYVDIAQISLTERCSLKCEKCAHACYNVDSSAEDMSFEQVCHSADSFFAKTNKCGEFVLIGGEPLLYGKLSEVIGYIGQRYRKQMLMFSITTNGTIMPSQDLLQMCRKYNVVIKISNYSAEIPWMKDKYEKLLQILGENEVKFYLNAPDQEWMDYGFEWVDHGSDQAELINVFDSCKTPCREIRENRYYYCVMARSVSDNLHKDAGAEDYLDMDSLTGADYKKILLEFNMGFSDKGYLDMCRYCNGGKAYQYPIPAAKQKR